MTTTKTTYRLALVHIADIPTNHRALVLGDEKGDILWNGWLEPIFTLSEALSMADWMAEYFEASIAYDVDADEIVITEDGEEERFGSTLVDGEKYYSVGTGIYCWEESSSYTLTIADTDEEAEHTETESYESYEEAFAAMFDSYRYLRAQVRQDWPEYDGKDEITSWDARFDATTWSIS